MDIRPDRNALAARRRAQLDEIVVKNPREADAHKSFDFLIEHGRCRQDKGKMCVLLTGPAQAGKSTIINSYAEAKNTPEALGSGRLPVLHVTLEANVTRKGLAQDILGTFEEFGYEVGSLRVSETILLKRVRANLKGAGTELLILDEFHHLINSDNAKLACSVGETIKRMLIKGICPIALAGIEAARAPLTLNSQLMQRSIPELNLYCLKADNADDLDLLVPFIVSFIKKANEIISSDKSEPKLERDVLFAIIEVTHGVLGAICNLIKDAFVLATLDGREKICREDLADSAERNFVQNGLYVLPNPFKTTGKKTKKTLTIV